MNTRITLYVVLQKISSQTEFSTHFAPLTLVNFWQFDVVIKIADKIAVIMMLTGPDIFMTANSGTTVVILCYHHRAMGGKQGDIYK